MAKASQITSKKPSLEHLLWCLFRPNKASICITFTEHTVHTSASWNVESNRSQLTHTLQFEAVVEVFTSFINTQAVIPQLGGAIAPRSNGDFLITISSTILTAAGALFLRKLHHQNLNNSFSKSVISQVGKHKVGVSNWIFRCLVNHTGSPQDNQTQVISKCTFLNSSHTSALCQMRTEEQTQTCIHKPNKTTTTDVGFFVELQKTPTQQNEHFSETPSHHSQGWISSKNNKLFKNRRKKKKNAKSLPILAKNPPRLLYTEIQQKGERLLLSLMPTHSSVSALGGLRHNTLTPAAPPSLQQHVVTRCAVVDDHLHLW